MLLNVDKPGTPKILVVSLERTPKPNSPLTCRQINPSGHFDFSSISNSVVIDKCGY